MHGDLVDEQSVKVVGGQLTGRVGRVRGQPHLAAGKAIYTVVFRDKGDPTVWPFTSDQLQPVSQSTRGQVEAA